MKLNQDFVVAANSDFNLRFIVTNESDGSLIPVGDILGASWAMTPLEEEVSPLIQKDWSLSEITIPEDGIVLVILKASDTNGLSGEFSHELRLLDAGGVRPAARGKVTIKYQISNNPL